MEIEQEEALTFLPARFEDALDDLDAGVVHEDVDGPIRLLRAVEPCERDLGIAEVGLHHVRAVRRILREPVEAIEAPSDERDPRAAVQILAGDGFADPARGSGDDDVLGHDAAAYGATAPLASACAPAGERGCLSVYLPGSGARAALVCEGVEIRRQGELCGIAQGECNWLCGRRSDSARRSHAMTARSPARRPS